MLYVNTKKLRKDLTKISDPNPEVMRQKILTWAEYHTKRQKFIDSIRGQENYTEQVIAYDKEQPRRLWNYNLTSDEHMSIGSRDTIQTASARRSRRYG